MISSDQFASSDYGDIQTRMRDFQFPGRSPVRAAEAAVATSHPLATLGGGRCPEVPAATPSMRPLPRPPCWRVVEPQSTGIGGDCFMLYVPEGAGQGHCLQRLRPRAAEGDASTGIWTRVSTDADLRGPCGDRAGRGRRLVPRAARSWQQEPADAAGAGDPLCREGYVVHDRVAFDWAEPETDFGRRARITHLPAGRQGAEGRRVHRQPELAATLRVIAKQGRAGFYEGAVADDIVRQLKNWAACIRMEDFAATKGDYVAPVTTPIAALGIFQMPPNNQGLTALLMLNVLVGLRAWRARPHRRRAPASGDRGRAAGLSRPRPLCRRSGPCPGAGEELLSPAYADRLRADDPSATAP